MLVKIDGHWIDPISIFCISPDLKNKLQCCISWKKNVSSANDPWIVNHTADEVALIINTAQYDLEGELSKIIQMYQAMIAQKEHIKDLNVLLTAELEGRRAL